MTRVRTNVVIFRKDVNDDWHLGVCVNAETKYATIVDIKGNVYKQVHSVRDYLDEGSFQVSVNDEEYNRLSTSNQVFK